MPQSLSKVYVHIIFSTKNRRNLIDDNIDLVIDYIEKQHDHHEHNGFQEEFLNFLNKYNIGYDERYVWD